jgi:very-short-patch-repair endonuclease
VVDSFGDVRIIVQAGMEEQRKNKPKSSPPYKGGVAAGRGGSPQMNNLPTFKTFRTTLRKNLTPAEAAFWNLVKNSRLDGRKFRRQHRDCNYILDFYCPSERLGIELDGEVHFNEPAREYDFERKLFLQHFGIKVVRLENKWVFEEPEQVLRIIRNSFGWRFLEMGEPPRC